VPAFPDNHPLIVFDGKCILCCANAQFVLKHDHAGRFRLTTAQGQLGQALYRHFGLATDHYETLLVIEDERLLTRADAALAIASSLGWPWRSAKVARIVPRPLRDFVYDLVARNRFRLFGRRDRCWMPSPENAERIL
jgi:predicted DCC family thiol-disulfide oxidoreductase YuxK